MHIPLLHTAVTALSLCAPNPDLDRSGVVDSHDISIVLASWGNDGAADLTGDGLVEQADLISVMDAQGERWAYANERDALGSPAHTPINVDSVVAVREDGWDVQLVMSNGEIRLPAGNVIWWIFELAEHGWAGPVYASEMRLRALGVLEYADPPQTEGGLWTLWVDGTPEAPE